MTTSEPQTSTAPYDAEDATRLTVHLRDHGRLEIATILHVQQAHSGLTRYGFEIDTINAPRRFQMVLQQASGTLYEVDHRVYLLADPQDERKIFVLPQSATGGQKLPRGMNRFDPTSSVLCSCAPAPAAQPTCSPWDPWLWAIQTSKLAVSAASTSPSASSPRTTPAL